MSNKLLKTLAVVLILLIAVFFIAKKIGLIQNRNAIEVAVDKVSKRTIIEKVGTNGKIYPSKEVKLSVEVPGEVTKILIEEGDSVQKGDLLLVLNPSTYSTSVSRANAAYNQSLSNLSTAKARNSSAKAQYIIIEKDYNRKMQLLNNKIISSAEFDLVESQYYTALGEKEAASQSVQAAEFAIESAKASLKEANEVLGKTKVYAPMSGIVSKLNVELGEKVVGTAQMIGTELITIADLNNMELLVDVGENDVLRISVGDSAEIEVDAYLDDKFVGVVSHIAYSSNQGFDQQITKFQVKIKLLSSSYKHLVKPAEGHKFPFRPGLSATADIFTNRKENILTVPIQSVTKREDENGKNERQVVYLVKDNYTKEVKVETGLQDSEFIEITSNLSENADVVSAPFKAISKELEDSLKVSVIAEEDLFKGK
ncbi:MAG: efflux RND transporter periplasmic adaptor subunit [Chitinophagales bacterium]